MTTEIEKEVKDITEKLINIKSEIETILTNLCFFGLSNYQGLKN